MTSVQEYLTGDFEADREYVDSELIERPGEMREVLDGVLRTQDPNIAVPLAEVFET